MRLLVYTFITTGQQKQTKETSVIMDAMRWLRQQTKLRRTNEPGHYFLSYRVETLVVHEKSNDAIFDSSTSIAKADMHT